jgi:hypothetical protein
MSLPRTLRVLLTVLAATASIGVPAVSAQPARAVGVTPPRLSFVDGEVSYWRPGAEDWVPAQINTALAAGDSLYAGNGGNLELEIGTRAYVRAGSGSQLGIESLETGYLQLRVPAGHATVDLRRLPDGQQIEVGTPNGAFLIGHAGYYRFDVDDEATRFSARRGGLARVVPAGGDEVEVGSSQQVVVSGTETATISRVAPSDDDAWDRWNYDRTAELGEQPRSAQYVPPDVAGVDDLDRYGDWRDTPKYGSVWVPREVSTDWAPYSTGRWVWDGYYGWTWVDDSPWGWAPYHYGRWCWNDGYWGWAPGPIAVRPVYAPALVAFFGGPRLGLSVVVGSPLVSWVALGWGEPVVPWWGPRGFVGRPYWGGWGGPRVVNNVVINNTTIINVNNINRYDNFRHQHAVIGIAGDRFGRGPVEPIRVDQDRVRNLRPVRGELGVRPVRESLVPRAGRGERPPDSMQNRRVVATRAPQDPARQPRAAGLVPADSRRQPAPRLVSPRSERPGGREQSGGWNVPPPSRGVERGSVGERGQGTLENPEVRGRSGRPGEVRGGNVGERSNDAGRSPSAVDRVPGGRDSGGVRGNTTRDAPQPPSLNDRIPRDRSGRERGSVEGRDGGRAPAPPFVDRGRQPQRGRSTVDEPIRMPPVTDDVRGRERDGSRGNDVSTPPPARERNRSQERGRSEIQSSREPAPPVDRGGGAMRERGRSRNEQPQRAPNINVPRQAAPPRSFDGGGETRERGHQRIELPQRAPQMPPAEDPRRNERQSSGDSGRSSRQPSVQRESAPRPQRQEAPRIEPGGAEPRNGARNDGDPAGEQGRRGRDQYQ